MGLFKKHYCFRCGRDLGLLGGVKIANVSFCNNCNYSFTSNSNLPYIDKGLFNDPNKISEFIDFAEENKRQFQQLNITRSFNEKDSIYIDENKRLFYVFVSPQTINNAAPNVPKNQSLFSFFTDDYNDEDDDNCDATMLNANSSGQFSTPIIFSCKSLTDIRIDIQERKLDNNQNDLLSKVANIFNPTHTYSYNYYVSMYLNHRWVNSIKIKLNPRDIIVTVTQRKGVPLANPRQQSSACINCERAAEEIKTVFEKLRRDSYMDYNSGDEKQYAVNTKEQVNKAPRTIAIQCPYCGAPAIAYEGTTIRCSYCGMYLDA